MPIYAYRCTACGHAKDILQKITDDVLTVCPACGAACFVKQVTAAGFQLKGSGWYVTDFRGGTGAGKDATQGAAEEGAKEGAKEVATDAAKGSAATADKAPAAAPAPAVDASKPAPAVPKAGA